MPVAAAITGAAALAAAGIGAAGAAKANKRGVALAREMRQSDIDMWHKTNAYNSPAMQMQRLREAGLNPNLIYGNGATHTAQQAPSAKVPEVQNEMASIANVNLAPAVAMYQDFKLKIAQMDNIKKQMEYTDSKIINEGLKAIATGVSTQKNAFSLSQAKRLADSQFETAMANLDKIRQDVNLKMVQQRLSQEFQPYKIGESKARLQNLIEDNKLKKLENQLQTELKPYGLTQSDNFLYRLILPLFGPRRNQTVREYWNER
jgi:hypothetical protein